MRDGLVAFALGMLHAALLLLLVVALLVAQGTSGPALRAIGTGAGIALGAYLALLSWGATAWALRGAHLATLDAKELIGRAGLGGVAAGAAFVAGAFLGFALAAGELEVGSLLFLLVATPFAGAGGALVALMLALIDLALYQAARGLVKASSA